MYQSLKKKQLSFAITIIINLLFSQLCLPDTSNASNASFIAPLSKDVKLPENAFHANLAEPIPMEAIQRFTTVLAQIKQYYIKKTDYETLFNHAIRGMLTALDPHSGFLDKHAIDDLETVTTGEFSGLGIEIIPNNGFIYVISPIDHSPASRAGIQAGDLIIKINKQPVKQMSIDEAVKKMRGKKGTFITLTVLRKGEKSPRVISIKRDKININTVTYEILQKHYAYIRISFFHTPTFHDLKDALQTIQKKTKNLQGMILDLRNNPGGLLESAVSVANAFLEFPQSKYHSVIVSTQGRLLLSHTQNKITGHDLTHNIPLVVLINSGSASASEIVAGALQDYHRALIIGTKSFGKGSVQTILSIDKTSAIKLTTALYYTPSGKSIQATGINPDLIIPSFHIKSSSNTTEEEGPIDIYEQNLEGYIKNKNPQPENIDSNNTRKEAEKDFQRFMALELLKGMKKNTIFKNHTKNKKITSN